MEKTFEGWLFNRMETIGNKEYNHVGCEGENKNFGDFLTQFVPNVGMRRKVKFTIETIGKVKRMQEKKQKRKKEEELSEKEEQELEKKIEIMEENDPFS